MHRNFIFNFLTVLLPLLYFSSRYLYPRTCRFFRVIYPAYFRFIPLCVTSAHYRRRTGFRWASVVGPRSISSGRDRRERASISTRPTSLSMTLTVAVTRRQNRKARSIAVIWRAPGLSWISITSRSVPGSWTRRSTGSSSSKSSPLRAVSSSRICKSVEEVTLRRSARRFLALFLLRFLLHCVPVSVHVSVYFFILNFLDIIII